MASAEARAAALALPSPGGAEPAPAPAAAVTAPASVASPSAAGAAAPGSAPVTAAAAVEGQAPEGEPAAEPKAAEPPADAPKKVTFTDWQTLQHKTKKVQERESKAAEREAQLTAREKAIEEAKAAPFAKAWGAKDPAGLIRAWAQEHQVTWEQALEALSHQTIHEGALPPNSPLDPVQEKLAKVEKAQKELDERIANERSAAQKSGMSQAFVGWATSEAVAKQYPVMSAEDPADIAEASWQLANQYRQENDGQWPSREWVAAELEQAARAFYGAKVKVFERYRSATEQATVKPATETGNPHKPESAVGTRDPSSPGGGLHSKTLTNKSASERSQAQRDLTREERRAAAMKLLG